MDGTEVSLWVWGDVFANRTRHAKLPDGRNIASLIWMGRNAWMGWLRYPDPMGTVVGRGFPDMESAQRAVEEAHAARTSGSSR